MADVGGGWWKGIAVPGHTHDWHTFGCVQGIGMVACTMTYENEVFLGTLPRFRDQSLAHQVALRLASMNPEDRWREIRDSPPLEWLSVLVTPDEQHPHSSPLDQQAQSYEQWRSAHPAWNDLFPPTLKELEARN